MHLGHEIAKYFLEIFKGENRYSMQIDGYIDEGIFISKEGWGGGKFMLI